MLPIKPNPKIKSRYRDTSTEIELHRFVGAGNGIPLGLYSGVEFIIEQSPDTGRRKLTTVPLTWEAMETLHAELGKIIENGRDPAAARAKERA